MTVAAAAAVGQQGSDFAVGRDSRNSNDANDAERLVNLAKIIIRPCLMGSSGGRKRGRGEGGREENGLQPSQMKCKSAAARTKSSRKATNNPTSSRAAK